jgi:transcription elongation factor GreB
VSKAFKKDDDTEAPLIAPRAPLPAGVPNYVTHFGLLSLRREHAEIARELSASEADASVRAALKARLSEVAQRIACAVPVDPSQQNHDEVRFGARVELRTAAGQSLRYRIVGVDEANATLGKIAFVAPLARALLGKRVGDEVRVRAPHGDDELEITRIDYAQADDDA